MSKFAKGNNSKKYDFFFNFQQVRLKIKFCLFVLYLPTNYLPPYSKIYIAFFRGKIILLFVAEMSVSVFIKEVGQLNGPACTLLLMYQKLY